MGVFNIFRILGDMSHTLSKLTLIWAIHINRSAEGVSLITQVLYAVVFCSRYLDLFLMNPFDKSVLYNTIMKIFYISTSLYIIIIMLKVYSRTRERERAWKFGAACLAGSLVLAPFVMLIFDGKERWSFFEFLWDFSIVLESVCVLPQLMLLRQTTVPTVIDSMYLIMLGSYRAWYILNWIERGMTETGEPRAIPVIFGVIQTLLYVDFAWVYWTRQRVKLRNGAVVDADDLSRGYLVSKILGPGRSSMDDPEGDGRPADASNRGWGRRGISVSADADVGDDDDDAPRPKPPPKNDAMPGRPDEREGMLSNPDAFADHDSDIDDTLPTPLPRGSGV